MVEVLRKEVPYGFEETVKRVEDACNTEGFGILLTKSIDGILKQKLGVDMDRYTMVLACAPELANMALEASKDAGTLFPCSFVVYEDEGRIVVAHTSIMKIAAETGLVPSEKMQPIIKRTGERVQAVWNRI